ncbi:paxillin isoform X5 [Homo sapiens]|nr:paxillin isoform X5 [Homo sapiens]
MSTSLGSNLSELDRLLLELNAVQHNPPGFPADEANSSPPLPGALSPLYGVPETNSPLGGKAGPLTKEKPKRNGGRGLEDVRPSVESLLDELESSVPSPVPAITVNQGEMSSPQRVTSTQQQTRISASSATRELDELMASLSDFKTSSSTVALSAPGLSSSAPSSYCSLPPSPPPMPSVFLPPTTIPSPRGQGHTPEFPCTEQSGRGLLPPVAPSWLDLAGLGVMPDTFNSRSPSVEGSLWAVGTESQGRDWRHLPTITSELSGAPRCHTVPCAGSTALQEPGEPQGPPASPSCPEEALAATWEQPWASEVFGPERMPPSGAARSFQEVTEPAVVAVDRQAIFPDTWTLTEEHGLQQERPRPEPGRLGSSSPASVTTEQLGAKMTERGSVARPTQGPETPRSPEGTTEAATQDGKEQPELPCAMAMGTPSTTERISTSGQIQGLEQRADGERCWAAGWPRDGGRSSPGGQDEGGGSWPLEEVVLLVSISSSVQEGEKYPHPCAARHRTPSLRSPDQPPPCPQFMAQGKTGSSSPPGGPPKPGSQLDSMLGSLQSDLNKLGVATVAKGVCGACKKPIAGQVVTAMGKTWHPEHFVCTHCQEEIGSRNFFERDGQPYCEKDYHNLFSPRCYYCNGPILDKVVTALDRTWHPEHFFCAQCGAFFGPEGFHEKDGKAYCRKDYFDMFAPKCGGCARAILENYISALNTLWHPECFVCRECFTPFVNGSFFEHDGQPYCEVHYHERRGSLCSGCQKPITGRCITAMAKKFHPEHFVCAFCLKQLNKGTFKEQNDKPYCQNCFLKLFC